MIDPALTDVLRRRILASLIDLATVAGITALVARIVAVTFNGSTTADGFVFDGGIEDYNRWGELSAGFSRMQAFGDTWYVWDLGRLALIAAVGILLALLIWVVLPSRTDQTPGKAVFGLRVTDLLGESAATSQHVTRSVFALVDALPYVLPGLLGWVLALSADHRQRIGDRLAQTVVIDARKPLTATGGSSAGGESPRFAKVSEPSSARLAERLPDNKRDADPASTITPPSTVAAPSTSTEPAPVSTPTPEAVAAPEPVPTPDPVPVLFDDNAPIDIVRSADDLPRRRGSSNAEVPQAEDAEDVAPQAIIPTDIDQLLAADNQTELRPDTDRRPAIEPLPRTESRPEPEPSSRTADEAQATRPAMDRMESAAWERPVAEAAPVWKPPAGERPLVDEDPGQARNLSTPDRPAQLGGAAPEPVSLDFTPDDFITPEDFLAPGAPTAAPTAAPTEPETVEPETVGPEPAEAASEPADEGASDPRSPTWSDEWKAWVVFDPARNAWLRHDAEQDLWLEL